MKHAFLKIISVLIILSSASLIYAQDYVAPAVEVSKEKVKLDGKIYFSHIVMERQTLYSISKAYGVEIEEIYAANPTLKETGLKKNAIILIPSKDDEKPSKAEEKLSKAEEKAEKQQKKAEKTEKVKYIIHTRKWYEDLDAISEKYGVPVEVIMRVNSLQGRKLSNRQKLKIPVSPEFYDVPDGNEEIKEEATPKDEGGESLSPKMPNGSQAKDTADVLFASKDKVNIVLMLPFNAQSDKKSSSSLDFYSGALLAARDLGEQGIDIDLSVYDTGGGVLPITRERLEMTDIVIGPVSSHELSRLLEKTPESTDVISPLDHKADSLANNHSNFIQAPSSYHAQVDDMVKWVGEEFRHGDKILVLKEKGQDDSKRVESILNSRALLYSAFSYSILEGRNISENLAQLMTSEGCNRVIVASESEAFVNDVVRNLNLMIHNKYDVTLYCPSKIKSFETIEVENLHNANLHVSSSYSIDYDDSRVQKFLLQYRALFGAEPTPFAFQGYDTLYFFAEMCAKYGDSWKLKLGGTDRMLQSDFRLESAGESVGYINKAVRRTVYGSNYSISHVQK